MTTPLLEVNNLHVQFTYKKSATRILKDVTFSLKEGRTLCVVGESGCGKSLTSLSVMRLLPKGGEISKGQIKVKGEDLSTKTQKQMSKIRGNDIAMIFQEPMTSLNPVQTVGKQIAEPMLHHMNISKKEAWKNAIDLLQLVGIPSPEKRVHSYPHEMSGGMRQRVMIAIALSCNPDLLIADEPTTALDVTIQAQILELMKRLQQERKMGIMMITHDLAVVNEMADDVLVMYAGQVVESTSRDQLFENPQHPYTQGLLECIPDVEDEKAELHVIKGTVPAPDAMPVGCRFADRCPYAQELCFKEEPQAVYNGDDHIVRCWKVTERWKETQDGKGVNENGATTLRAAKSS